MYFAVIDLGTNSVRLLIAEKTSPDIYLPRYSRVEITRLGEGTAQGGELRREAVERTLDAVKNYLIDIKEYKAELTAVMGTSAVRESRNKERLISRLKKEMGIELKVLSGIEEAELSYLGVVKSLPGTESPLVFDLGGGSTELIWRQGDRLIFKSLKLGVVRMTEAFISMDPPGKNELKEIERFAREYLNPLKEEMQGQCKQLIGVGGTITSLASVKQGLKIYDSNRVHGFILSREDIAHLLLHLASLKEGDRKKILGLQPQRADVISAGMVIVLTLMKIFHFQQVTVSEGDLLLGALYKFN